MRTLVRYVVLNFWSLWVAEVTLIYSICISLGKNQKYNVATTKTLYVYIDKYGSHCYMSLKYSVFCSDNGVLLWRTSSHFAVH